MSEVAADTPKYEPLPENKQKYQRYSKMFDDLYGIGREIAGEMMERDPFKGADFLKAIEPALNQRELALHDLVDRESQRLLAAMPPQDPSRLGNASRYQLSLMARNQARKALST